MRVLFVLLFLGGLSLGGANAQFSKDEVYTKITIRGLDKLYNLEFREAERLFEPVYKKYGEHPVSYLIKAILLQQEFAPISQNSIHFKEYLAYLEKCILLASDQYDSEIHKSDATFFLLAAHGYISRAYHAKKDYLKAGLEARKAYSYLKEGFELSKGNSEFYFTNGLYRYYREQYPETHPSIKPIIFFFTDGNKSQGLMDLRRASKTALFSKTEASFFLAGICLKYENFDKEALSIMRGLHSKYPRNPDFLLKYIESLLVNGKIDLANEKLKSLKGFKGVDYEMAMYVFGGEIAFVKADLEESKRLFEKAATFKREAEETSDLKSMAFCRLGEINLKLGEDKRAKEYFKLSLDIAEYSRIIKKAELELKKL